MRAKWSRVLQDAGYQAYVVGGAVRDLLLGLKAKDFDVATDAKPAEVKSLFRALKDYWPSFSNCACAI